MVAVHLLNTARCSPEGKRTVANFSSADIQIHHYHKHFDADSASTNMVQAQDMNSIPQSGRGTVSVNE